MRKTRKHFTALLVATTLSLFTSSQTLLAEDYGIRAFYGDKLSGRVVVMDVDNMSFIDDVYTQGIDPYPVDQAGKLDKVYAITRGSNSIDVIDASTLETIGLIELSHYPRSSEAYNEALGLQLVTGVDKPMASLIDVNSDSVVETVGLNEIFSVEDYGGSNATGHPFWFDEDKFALIDRPNRVIHLYMVKKIQNHKTTKVRAILLDSIDTPTAVHHFVKRKIIDSGVDSHTYYALSEGAPDAGIAPSILKFILTPKNKLRLLINTPLSSEDIELMGSHHADMHPDGIHMYIGSTEGNVYVLNTDTMEIVKKVTVGKGAGHTTFVPERNIAIVTNHQDTFVSIIDTTAHTLIKNVTVSGAQVNGAILQSHSSFVHPNMDFFYAFASDNGIFYELNLDTLEVSRSVETGGTPLQGVFMCQGADCENLM